MLRLASASLAALALFSVASPRNEHALRLRIQALGQDTVQVRVSLSAAKAHEPSRWADTVAQTPAVLSIADSVQSIHIVVNGSESVRATITDAQDPARNQVAAEGRDLMLSRDARGRFHRGKTPQSLVP
jgi:hypothetical protein